MKNEDLIDIVVLWVDGNDEKWLKEKEKYTPDYKNKKNDCPARYRDWDNLKYWFRAIEKNAVWCNRIFFITWGHLPSWLNVNNPKIKIIKHSDFIPKQYLPTYNVNTIEMNLYRIKELNENFVLFNDDTFLMSKTKSTDYFKKGMPVEFYSEVINFDVTTNDTYSHTLYNNMTIINRHFNKRKTYIKNLNKYFNYRYGLRANISTFMLSIFGGYSMIANQHLPVPLKKSIYEEIWKKEFDILDNSSKNKFRNLSDVSQQLVRYWQLASGKFYPKTYKFGKMYTLKDDNTEIIKEVKQKKYKAVCFNDNVNISDFENAKKTLNVIFEDLYPDKSSFEI